MKMSQYFSKTRIYTIFRFNFFDSSFQDLCLTQAFFKKMQNVLFYEMIPCYILTPARDGTAKKDTS